MNEEYVLLKKNDPLVDDNFNPEKNPVYELVLNEGDDDISVQYVVPFDINNQIGNNWKDYRESALSCILRCLKCFFYTGILSGSLIGIVGTILALICATFEQFCATYDYLPLIAHQVRLVATSTAGWFLEFTHVFVMYIIFGKEMITQLHIFEWNISIACLDTIYRLYWFLYIAKRETRIEIFLIQLMMICVISINSLRVAKRFYTSYYRRLMLIFQVGLQFLFSIVVTTITLHYIIPMYAISSDNNKVLIVVAFTLIGFGMKHVSKMAALNMGHVNHPGTSYGVLICTYIGMTNLSHMLHAGIKTPFLFSIVCTLHSFFGFLERLSLIFKDCFYKNRYKKCARKQRLIADVIICGLIQETATTMTTLGTVQFMLYKFSVLAGETNAGYLYGIIPRLILAVVIELIFSIPALFILTWYHNTPILKVWQKKWRQLLLANFGMLCFSVLYVTSSVVVLVAKYIRHEDEKLLYPKCDLSEIYFFMR